MWLPVQSHDETIQNPGVQETVKVWQKPFLRQAFVVLGPTALILSAGMALGTATVMIPQIKANDSSIKLDADMESWLYSVQGFAAVLTVLTVPYLSHVKGYKFAFLGICLPIILACNLQFFATSAIQLLTSAILQGLTIGGNVTLSVIIVAEYADPKYRGLFLVAKSASFFWGIWIANAIGTFSNWRNIPLVCIWPAIFALVSCLMWPESPYWLASKGRHEKCKKSFRWLRGQGDCAEKELSLLTGKKSSPQKFKNVFTFMQRTIALRQFYMPMVLNIFLFFLYQSCGKVVSQTYVLVIIKEITQNEAVAYTGMLIIDGVTVLGMYMGSYVAMKIPRRVMFLSTSASTVFFLYLLSFYLYLIQFKIINENSTVSLILLILYSFSVSWGPMVLSTSIFAEITPMRFKPFISSVTVCIMFILQTGFLKFGPWLFKSVGLSGTFAVYGTLTLLPLLILFKYLPETRNRTLEDIELFLIRKDYCSTPLSQCEVEEMLSNVNNSRNIN